MRLVVQGPEDRAAGANLHDGNRTQPEVEVPEVLHGESKQHAYDDPEYAAVADDHRPASLIRGSVAVAEHLVAVVCTGLRVRGHLRQELSQSCLDSGFDRLEVLSAGGVKSHGPAPPTCQRVAELGCDLLVGQAFP